MNKLLTNAFVALIFLSAMACSSSNDSGGDSADPPKSMIEKKKEADPKGIGEIKTVTLNNPLDQNMVKSGKAIYEMKCAACHRLDDKRVVGPGWAGLSTRRQPEWTMNMITNVDVMLAEDPQAQAMLEECLTRMPNQNVSIGDARDILEFVYFNDAETGSE